MLLVGRRRAVPSRPPAPHTTGRPQHSRRFLLGPWYCMPASTSCPPPGLPRAWPSLALGPLPGLAPETTHPFCSRLFLPGFLAAHVQAASVFFRSSQSGGLAHPGKMDVFHVPTWNLPGLGPGKASRACARQCQGGRTPALLGRLGGHTCPNQTFFPSGNKACSGVPGGKQAHPCLGEAPDMGAQTPARARSPSPGPWSPGPALAPCTWLWLWPPHSPTALSSGLGATGLPSPLTSCLLRPQSGLSGDLPLPAPLPSLPSSLPPEGSSCVRRSGRAMPHFPVEWCARLSTVQAVQTLCPGTSPLVPPTSQLAP